jgi:hypothetical protein
VLTSGPPDRRRDGSTRWRFRMAQACPGRAGTPGPGSPSQPEDRRVGFLQDGTLLARPRGQVQCLATRSRCQGSRGWPWRGGRRSSLQPSRIEGLVALPVSVGTGP